MLRTLLLTCIFRLPNQQTIKDSFPLSIIEDLIDSFGSDELFRKLDLTPGYRQIRIDPPDE